MSDNTMLAAYCCDYDDDGQNISRLIANYKLRSCDRPSLKTPLLSNNNYDNEGNNNSSATYRYPPGTVLIQTLAASICGSDLFGLGGCTSCPQWRRPTDLLVSMQGKVGGSGHEAIGKIVDMVPTTLDSKFVIGQRVLAMPSTYLYKVASMRKKFEEETGKKIEEIEETGAFCEYFVSHQCVCLHLPDHVPRDNFDYRWYTMAQPLGTVLHACQKLGSVINLNIAVVGQGQNGLIISQMLANMGARRIIALDLLEERLVYSKKNKATHTIRVTAPMDTEAVRSEIERITEGEMCHVAVDMVGHQNRTIQLCSELTKRGGKVLLFGLPPAKSEEQMNIRFVDLSRNLSYVCAHSPEFESFRLALELVEQGRFDPSTIFSHEMPFCKFREAYDKACNYEDGVVKVLLAFPE
mmetsp:Transcript_13688/g.29405  ORF Transcript_13688/g.29405 Transcript_13688/m.29405 type:complete len:409 (-) Transcript_13688:138-1364(-)